MVFSVFSGQSRVHADTQAAAKDKGGEYNGEDAAASIVEIGKEYLV
jgi:hypothetical protein